MNRFLEYLLCMLEEDKQILGELLQIDNHIQKTNLKMDDLRKFLEENLLKSKLLLLNPEGNMVVLMEGNPFLTIKLLNDFPSKIKDLFISRSFVAINKWLVKKGLDYWCNEGVILEIEVDVEYSYNHYFDSKNDILVIGSAAFINGAQNDFSKELLKLEVE